MSFFFQWSVGLIMFFSLLDQPMEFLVIWGKRLFYDGSCMLNSYIAFWRNTYCHRENQTYFSMMFLIAVLPILRGIKYRPDPANKIKKLLMLCHDHGDNIRITSFLAAQRSLSQAVTLAVIGSWTLVRGHSRTKGSWYTHIIPGLGCASSCSLHIIRKMEWGFRKKGED